MTALNMGYGLARITDLDRDVLPGRAAEIPDVVNLVGGERREGAVSGMKALWMALLEDGIRCYLSPEAKLRLEAERWIESSYRRGTATMSFEAVCAGFGLDPGATRLVLRRLREGGVSGFLGGRARANVRHNSPIRAKRRRRGRVERPAKP